MRCYDETRTVAVRRGFDTVGGRRVSAGTRVCPHRLYRYSTGMRFFDDPVWVEGTLPDGSNVGCALTDIVRGDRPVLLGWFEVEEQR